MSFLTSASIITAKFAREREGAISKSGPIVKWPTCLRNCRSSIGQWQIRAGFLEPRAYRYWPTNCQLLCQTYPVNLRGFVSNKHEADRGAGSPVTYERSVVWEVSTLIPHQLTSDVFSGIPDGQGYQVSVAFMIDRARSYRRHIVFKLILSHLVSTSIEFPNNKLLAELLAQIASWSDKKTGKLEIRSVKHK